MPYGTHRTRICAYPAHIWVELNQHHVFSPSHFAIFFMFSISELKTASSSQSKKSQRIWHLNWPRPTSSEHRKCILMGLLRGLQFEKDTSSNSFTDVVVPTGYKFNVIHPLKFSWRLRFEVFWGAIQVLYAYVVQAIDGWGHVGGDHHLVLGELTTIFHIFATVVPLEAFVYLDWSTFLIDSTEYDTSC